MSKKLKYYQKAPDELLQSDAMRRKGHGNHLAGLIKESKPDNANREITPDTIYLIALGVLQGETAWYVGLQLDRPQQEILNIATKYHEDIFANMVLCSCKKFCVDLYKTLYKNFICCTATKRTHINEEKINRSNKW